MDDVYERLFTRTDIERELNITRSAAVEFLAKYGTKIGRPYVITQREFRGLQMSGETAEWLRVYEQRQKREKELFKSKEVI